MPADKILPDNSVRPTMDICTPLRVEVLLSLYYTNLAVKHTMVPGTVASTPSVKRGFMDLKYEHVTERG